MYLPSPSRHKYRQLLGVLIANFLVAPFLQGGLGSIISALLLLYVMIVIVKSFSLPNKLFWAYVLIAVLAFSLQLGPSVGWTTTAVLPFSLLAQSIYVLYLGVAALLIMREIITATTITMDTIRGGICAYFLIAFIWALFYGIVATLNPHAFSATLIQPGSYLQPIHFSVTTLTTLGFGDIVPVSTLAIVLTDTEAIIGQLYPTVFIAILVGGYLSQKVDQP
ncbi:ion channel [Acaryochloris marina NIES-2412]|uniref:ion channel n=1 Tax=Acaryochloris marina TaxID=155978 RepID=UPI004058A22B